MAFLKKLRQLTQGIPRIAGGLGVLVSRSPIGTTISLDPNILSMPGFPARVVMEGPNGEPDVPGERYWVREIHLRWTGVGPGFAIEELPLDSSGGTEARWVVAVNLAELGWDTGFGNNRHAIVRSDLRLRFWPPSRGNPLQKNAYHNQQIVWVWRFWPVKYDPTYRDQRLYVFCFPGGPFVDAFFDNDRWSDSEGTHREHYWARLHGIDWESLTELPLSEPATTSSFTFPVTTTTEPLGTTTEGPPPPPEEPPPWPPAGSSAVTGETGWPPSHSTAEFSTSSFTFPVTTTTEGGSEIEHPCYPGGAPYRFGFLAAGFTNQEGRDCTTINISGEMVWNPALGVWRYADETRIFSFSCSVVEHEGPPPHTHRVFSLEADTAECGCLWASYEAPDPGQPDCGIGSAGGTFDDDCLEAGDIGCHAPGMVIVWAI